MNSRFLPSSQTSGRMYNTVVWNKFKMWKWCRSPTYAVICKQLLNANDRNRVRWVVLGLSQDEHRYVWKPQRDQIKGRPNECYHLLSHWLIPWRIFQRKSGSLNYFLTSGFLSGCLNWQKNELQANKSSLKYVFIMRCSSLSKIFLSSNPFYGVRNNIKS